MAGSNGGARPGAGRKPKADELTLIQTMDAILVPTQLWEKVAELVLQGDSAAIKLWANYRFGMPKQENNITFDKPFAIDWINNNPDTEATGGTPTS